MVSNFIFFMQIYPSMTARLLIFLCLCLASCGPVSEKADFVFLNGAEPESLDPAIITGQLEGRLVNALFEGLTARNPQGQVIPGVASGWAVSQDGKTYTFYLRPDAHWSNGDFVTAHDFYYSWKRTLTPELAAEYAYQLYYIENAELFNTGKLTDFSKVGIRVINDQTFEVHLAYPTPFFLDLCAFPTLMPVHEKSIEALKSKGLTDWTKPGRLVSNGAYMLDDWRLNYRVRLRANPHYWDYRNVNLKVVDALPVSKENTAFNLYYSGAADLILDKNLIPSMILDSVKGRPDFHTGAFLGTYFYRFNVTKKPFDDPRIRKAFSLVIDKKRIVEKITKAGEPVANHFVPPGVPGYQSPEGLTYNPAEARKLLADAGFPDGKGFPHVGLLFADRSVAKAVATEVQAMIEKELNIRLELEQKEWKVYLNSMSNLDYDLAASSWVGDYNDANTFMDMFVTGGGNNRTGWSNKTYDQLFPAQWDPKLGIHVT